MNLILQNFKKNSWTVLNALALRSWAIIITPILALLLGYWVNKVVEEQKRRKSYRIYVYVS
jgi:hypothetical protein